MSDETVIVRNQGTIFLGGPPLVKAATGEVVTAEELGGGELHARSSGVVDHLAADDDHALEIVRAIVATLPPAGEPRWERQEPRAPTVAPDTVLDMIPIDTRNPYDIRHVLRTIVDASDLHEFKELYGETLVCAFAHIDGHPVGILANNGILFSESRAQRRALHRALRSSCDPARVLPEHQRLHGRSRLRGSGHCQGWGKARDRRGVRASRRSSR